jgi:dephospho-CoA kinase
MKVIGVTGGIASGKSTVARIICHLGGKIIDADVIAKRIMRKGSRAFDEAVSCFGTGILNDRGGIDRKKLASIVFKDNELLRKLNDITHKYVANSVYRKLGKLMAEGRTDFVVLDVPIPVEKGFLDVVDEVWVVTADKEVRIKRIMERGNLSREEAIDRINSQLGEEEYKRLADVVIENNGTWEELEQNVARLFIRKKTG